MCIRGNVLIVDEAHNLVDAVNGAHSAQVAAAQLRAAQSQLSGYYQRFRSRLAAGAALDPLCGQARAQAGTAVFDGSVCSFCVVHTV